MPSSEDDRRFRRLAIGSGMRPEDVLELVADGRLTVYNRPSNFDLTTVGGIERFHEAVRRHDAQLVLLDSVSAAFCGSDMNDNSRVRALFSAAFSPLTSEGRSVLALHHRRKAAPGKADDARAAMLGAQSWGAASNAVFGLERLTDGDEKERNAFRCRLSLTGSWTPDGDDETVIETKDVEDGTTVTALDVTGQLQRGGLTGKQRGALALTKLVRLRRSVLQRDALDELSAELGISARTMESALAFAKKKRWVRTEGGHRVGAPLELVPGPVEEGEI